MRIINSFLLVLLCTTWLLGQRQAVEGTVISEEDGFPLIGVSVLLKGTNLGTITDIDGYYQLQTESPNDTILFTYTGFKDQEIIVGNQTKIDVTMGQDSELLDEVVVIGYGVQKKKVATGSISKIGSENLDGYQVENIQSALEGQVSGLIVSESSGQPGANKSILIRGISTNGDNSPLFVVDGLQVDNINNLNPSDIESVDVLKDAASAAIYGARGGNGVVIITTKKGTKGKGELTYEGFLSTSRPWKLPTLLGANDYIDLTREKFANGGQTEALNTLGFPQLGDQVVNTDWMNTIFNNGPIRSHKLSASGENLFMSLEYWDQEGVIGQEKSNFRRISGRLNASKEITDFLTVGENLFINRIDNQNLGVNSAFGTVISDAFALDPLTPVNDPDSQFGFGQSRWVQNEFINPLSRIFIANNDGHSDQIIGNVFLEFKPWEKLRLRGDLGIDYLWFQFIAFTPDFFFHPAVFNISNDVAQGFGFFQTQQAEAYANYTDSFGKHNLDVILGTSYRQSDSERASGSTQFIPSEVQFDPNFQIIDAGQDTTDLAGGGIGVSYRLNSYYSRALYNYDSKYLLSASLRADQSSNFGANFRTAIFPSFSLGWVISEEDFFNAGPINFLKVRGSWGLNGNDRIRALAFAARIVPAFAAPIGGQIVTGAAPASIPNPDIRWEASNQIDLGVEIRLFDDALTAEFDIYQKTTEDLLQAQPIPGLSGATENPISNLGEIRNRGFEASVNYKFNVGKVRISTGLNYTTFSNEVIDVAGEAGFIEGWRWPVRNQAITRLSEGFPVGHFVGLQTDGIFQSENEVFSHIGTNGALLQPNAQPGDLRFVDTNGDNVINTDDITDIGSPWPDHIIGFTLGASIGGFDFNAVLGTQIGHDIFRAYERSDITFTNYQDFWLDRWTPENPGNDLPRLSTLDLNNNQRASDFYVEDGTFLRLRNLQVGYNFSSDILDKISVQGLRLYVSANNLFTLTGYRGFDPEIGTNNNDILDTGIDRGFYPSNTSLGAGLRVTF